MERKKHCPHKTTKRIFGDSVCYIQYQYSQKFSPSEISLKYESSICAYTLNGNLNFLHRLILKQTMSDRVGLHKRYRQLLMSPEGLEGSSHCNIVLRGNKFTRKLGNKIGTE